MTPEKLAELEALEAAATPGPWDTPTHFWVRDSTICLALRNNAPALFAALREAWRERDEAVANYEQGATFGTLKRLNAEWEARCGAIEKERDEAQAGLDYLARVAGAAMGLRVIDFAGGEEVSPAPEHEHALFWAFRQTIRERDEAREDYRRQKQEALDAFAAFFAAQKERNGACELLAKLYERFACAKCVAPKPELKDPCPCGYAEIRNYLDKVMP